MPPEIRFEKRPSQQFGRANGARRAPLSSPLILYKKMKLYKYRPINKFSIQILINKKIWYAKPTSFNDPFDCGIDLDSNLSLEEKVEVLKFKMFQEGWSPQKVKQQLIYSFNSQGELNDKAENNILKIYDEVYQKRDNTGVLSLSSKNSEMLMWSHYADSHKGLCLEIEVEENSNTISRVKYSEDIPKHTLHDIFIKRDTNIFDLLITKHIDWDYENEYRIILDRGNLLHNLPGKITSVIFGLKTPNNEIEEIKKIASENLPDVKFKKCIKSKVKFEILIENV
ncbi:MAG TPA: hypothetical protein DD381_10690 [Lentisphaeria bacterium]|nr:MAG: hypothetical protein A2X47_01985 [Lentisphaerae bacterium GWF2_38_69]HBM16794.1 hypothetical protein [Lentisphaeria bacterium]